MAKTISKRKFFTSLGYTPHTGQEQIHAAIDDPNTDYVFAMCGTRFGKTFAAAYELCFHAMLPRAEFLGWCVAPNSDLAHIVYDMVHQIMRKIHGTNMSYDKNSGVMEFKNFGGGRSRIMRKSCHDAEGKGKLTGAGVDFMVIDEASSPEIKDTLWEAELRTRLNANSKLLAISTPRGQRGWFVTLFRKAQGGRISRVISITFPSWTNPHRFPGGFENPEIKSKFEGGMPMRNFLQEYGAQPMSAQGAFFDNPEDIDKCCVVEEWEEPNKSAEYASGLDLGIRRDSSVHTIVRAPLGFANSSPAAKVVFVRRMHRMPIEQQLLLVKQDQDRYGIHTVYTDGTGIGDPIIQQAQNMGIYVRRVVFTKTSKMPMMTNLLGLFQQRKIRLPTPTLCPSLRDQLLTYEWDKEGKTANAPSGFHDDYVASLALACKAFPAILTQGEGQVFHAKMSSSPTEKLPPRARETPQVGIKVIRQVSVDDAVQVFTPKRSGGSGGVSWGNSVVS
jgi:hypothetical protein